jgi:hypothetical protein
MFPSPRDTCHFLECVRPLAIGSAGQPGVRAWERIRSYPPLAPRRLAVGLLAIVWAHMPGWAWSGSDAAPGDGSGPDIHVATTGDDTWSGQAASPIGVPDDGPLATLAVAVNRSRQRGTEQPRRIVLHEGNYYLDEPIVLDHRDRGLTIEAASGARVVLYGGRPVTGWSPAGESLWAAPFSASGTHPRDVRMLVVNDRFCGRARLPETGHFEHASEWTVPWMSTTGGGWKTKPTPEDLTQMKIRPEDLPEQLDLRGAELTVYHMWDESVVGVARRDIESQTLTFANPAGHPPGAFDVKKYVVWNVAEGMSRPGQWYQDRAADRIVYWPLPDENMDEAVVVVPTCQSVIRLDGTQERPVRDVTLRGLTLSVTHTPLQAGGFGANTFAGAVSISESRDCRIEDCTVFNVGGQGIKEWNSRGLTIERCHIHHTGAGGIKCGGGDGIVSDCHVHDIGVLYPSAIGLWGGGTDGQGWHFVHNEIHDTPYTAIACGGNHHRIENNLIYHAMKELHDGGGIYITFCKEIVVRGNFIRDIVDTGGYGASAYYLDEQAEGCVVERNLSLRVARPSHNHMARANVLRNNVFICEADGQMTLAKSSEYLFEKNVFWAPGTIRFTNPAGFATRRQNVLFSHSGNILGVPLEDYQHQEPEPLPPGDGDLFVDPLLIEYETGLVRFAPDSPATNLGIEPLDVRSAGRRPRPLPTDH